MELYMAKVIVIGEQLIFGTKLMIFHLMGVNQMEMKRMVIANRNFKKTVFQPHKTKRAENFFRSRDEDF